MSKTIRLDKYLSEMGIGSRSEVKTFAKKGRIKVNDEVVKNTDLKVNLEVDVITFDGEAISYVDYEYYMLNKPQGVVSATIDNTCETVIDLLVDAKRKDLFPVGRLDKDTEGLLLISNDGDLTHQLLSPKKHVAKTYFAKVEGEVTENEIKLFKEGIMIDDEFKTLPAELTILKSGSISEIELTIYEGKFHQVKRMFEAVGKTVIYLKRLSMGSLKLDESLLPGQYRSLTKEELEKLRK